MDGWISPGAASAPPPPPRPAGPPAFGPPAFDPPPDPPLDPVRPPGNGGARRLAMGVGIAVAVALVGVAGAFVLSVDEADTPPVAAPATPSVTPMPMPGHCRPASVEDVAAITAALDGDVLVDAFVTEADGHRTIVANVETPSGDRVASAGYWAFDPAGELYAVSRSARAHSSLPDGSGLPVPVGSMGVDDGADCAAASAQRRSLGG